MTGIFAKGAVCGGTMWASSPTEAYLEVRRGGALPLPRAGKSAKRCRWQRKQAGFEEVPRLAATTVAWNRLARRWAREPRPYECVTRGATGGQRRPPLRGGALPYATDAKTGRHRRGCLPGGRLILYASIPRLVRYFFTIRATLKVIASSNSRRSRPVSFLIFSRR